MPDSALRTPPQLPAANDPHVAEVLERIVATCQARACRLALRPLAGGLSVSYTFGAATGRPSAVLALAGRHFNGEIEIFGAAGRAANSVATGLAELTSLVLDAVIERIHTSSLARLLAASLGTLDGITLIVGRDGGVLFATEQARRLAGLFEGGPGARSAPAPLTLARDVRRRVAEPRSPTSHEQQRTVQLLDRSWRLGVWELPNLDGAAPRLVRLLPTELPDAARLLECLRARGVSPRQAEVIACIIRGDRLRDVADRLGITEYTVKDHLKVVYARLGVSSRAELMVRLMSDGHL